jgi:hypothetical protein
MLSVVRGSWFVNSAESPWDAHVPHHVLQKHDISPLRAVTVATWANARETNQPQTDLFLAGRALILAPLFVLAKIGPLPCRRTSAWRAKRPNSARKKSRNRQAT